MKEYIEREQALKAACSWCAGNVDLDDDEPCCCVEIEEILNIPAADVVEVRHGEWKNDGKDWFCNRCNHNALCDKMTGEEVLSDICPHCGAKMDEN